MTGQAPLGIIQLVSFKAIDVTLKIESGIDKENQFDLDLKNLTFEKEAHLFDKIFIIDIVQSLGGESTDIVKIHVQYHTVFKSSEAITNDFLKSDFVKISAPAIGFPYVRSFISTLSVDAGLPPIILPSINFVQLSKENEAEADPGSVSP